LSGEFADLMLGYYGETIGVKNQQIVDAAAGQTKKPVITRRPADLIPAEWDKLRAETLNVPGSDGTDEDVLTYAMFPQVAPKFFATRKDGPKNVTAEPAPPPKPAAAEPSAKPNGHPAVPTQSALQAPVTYTVTVNGHSHKVTVAPQL
jgi:methylmalonyl-CoA carboxyltransferase 5S subunit